MTEFFATFRYFFVNISALLITLVLGMFITYTAFNTFDEPWNWIMGGVVGLVSAATGLTVLTHVVLRSLEWD